MVGVSFPPSAARSAPAAWARSGARLPCQTMTIRAGGGSHQRTVDRKPTRPRPIRRRRGWLRVQLGDPGGQLQLVALVDDPVTAPAWRRILPDHLEAVFQVQVRRSLEIAERLERDPRIADLGGPAEHLAEQAAAEAPPPQLRAQDEPAHRRHAVALVREREAPGVLTVQLDDPDG